MSKKVSNERTRELLDSILKRETDAPKRPVTELAAVSLDGFDGTLRRDRKKQKREFSKAATTELEEGLGELPEMLVLDLTANNPVHSGHSFSELTEFEYKEGSQKVCVLDKRLIKQLSYLKFEQMTHIQYKAIPALCLEQNDVMIKAQTGSGKTLAFLVPAIDKLLRIESQKRQRMIAAGVVETTHTKSVCSRKYTRILIVSPTRELAEQTQHVANKLTQNLPWVTTGVVVGGAMKKNSEKAAIRKGLTILLGTPGRILDHLNKTYALSLKYLSMIVFDEMDRLIDQGFAPQIREMVEKVRANATNDDWRKNKNMSGKPKKLDPESAIMERRIMRELAKVGPVTETILESDDDNFSIGIKEEKRTKVSYTEEDFEVAVTNVQSVVVSATLTKEIESFAKFCLKDGAKWIEDCTGESSSEWSIPVNLQQEYIVVKDERNRLLCLLGYLLNCSLEKKKVLVFINTSELVDYLLNLVQTLKWPEAPIMNSTSSIRQLKRGAADVATAKQLEKKKTRLFKHMIDDENFDLYGDSVPDDSPEIGFTQISVMKDTKCWKLHGNMTREERIGNLSEFLKCPNGGVLLTTDVAARGLNLPSVDCIVQFDPPTEICEYIHRIGRCARLGKKGAALLFLREHEKEFVNKLRDTKCCPYGIERIQESKAIRAFLPQSKNKIDQARSFVPSHLSFIDARNAIPFFVNRFTDFVESQKELAYTAQKAFLAVLRSYRTFTSSIVEFFPYSQLHTGHVAASLFVRHTPRQITTYMKSKLKPARKPH